jgi:hypothetical protein
MYQTFNPMNYHWTGDPILETMCVICKMTQSSSMIHGIKKLDCSKCEDMITIPCIQGLQELNCSNCLQLEVGNNFTNPRICLVFGSID